MKTKWILSCLVSLGLACEAFALRLPTAEAKGSFVKIVDGERPLGAPEDRDAPNVLYIKKSAIQRVSAFFSPRTNLYKVIVVTATPLLDNEGDEAKIYNSNAWRSYRYTFGNEAAAVAFCETLLVD